jgi:hypothetical protein
MMRFTTVVAGLVATMSVIAGVGVATAHAGTAPAATVPGSVVSDVAVDDRPVPVAGTEVADYAGFDLSGPARVRIHTNRAVGSVAVRPSALGIHPVRADDHTVELVLDHPAYVSVEFDGDVEAVRPLFLFADPPEADAPHDGDPGIRYLGPGTHTEKISLKSGQTLYLARGAVLKGRVEVVGTVNTGIRRDVRIVGRGVIDSADLDPDNQKPIRIKNADTVVVDGPTVVNRDGWSVVVASSERVQIRNTKIISWNRLADGIDILASQHVAVDRVFVRSGDDSIAIKNGKPGFADVAEPVEDVTVTGAVLFNGGAGNALEIGYELKADHVRGVAYRDVDIIHKLSDPARNMRAAISIHNPDGATVTDVTYDDIRLEQAEENFFYLGVIESAKGCAGGSIRNIRFHHIQISDPTVSPSVIRGCDATHAVDDVVFDDLTYRGTLVTTPAQLRFAINAYARDIRFTGGQGPGV